MSEKKNIFSFDVSEKFQKIPIEWGISHTLIKDISLESLFDNCNKKSTLICSFSDNDILTSVLLPEIVDAISEECCSDYLPCNKVIEGKMLFIKNLGTQNINIKNFLNEEQLILEPSSVGFLTAKNKLTQEWCSRVMGELNTTLQTAYDDSVSGEICLNDIQKDFEILGDNSNLNSLIPSNGILFTVANKDKSEIYLQSGFTHLQGVLGTAIGRNSVALGNQCLSVNPNSFTQGCKNTAIEEPNRNTGSIHMEGSQHINTVFPRSSNVHIEGDQCVMLGSFDIHIEGYKSRGSDSSSACHVEGSGRLESVFNNFLSYLHCEGIGLCVDNYSHIESQANSGLSLNSFSKRLDHTHAEGASSVVGDPLLITEANFSHGEIISYEIGQNSHNESEHFILPGVFAFSKRITHSEGKAASLTFFSHGEGYFSEALVDYSHSEGFLTTASGYSSRAEGYQTDSRAWYSHSEGIQTTSGTFTTFNPTIFSVGTSSHAEGYLSKTIENVSHAEGYLNTSIGIISHSEGYLTTASGYSSHSQGYSTTAAETASHSEGSLTVASAYASHASGISSFSNNVGSYSQSCGTISVANGDMQYQRLILTGITDLSDLSVPKTTDLQIFGLGVTNPTTQFPKLPVYNGYASYLLSADIIGIGTDGSVGTWFILAVALVSPLGAVTITSNTNQIIFSQTPGILGNIKPNNMAGADAPFFIATGPTREFSVRVSSLDILLNSQIKWSATIKITSRFF